MPNLAEEGERPHPDWDALDGMDVLKYHVRDVSGPACGMGTGRRSHCNDRLCARTHCQIS